MKKLGDHVKEDKQRKEWYYEYEGIKIYEGQIRIMLSVIEAKKSEKVNEVLRELHSNT